MSGGGGSGSNGGGIPDHDSGICQPIYKSISLLSPDKQVLSKLKVGNELEFEIISNGEIKSLRVKYENRVAGSIIKYATQIINCIEKGYFYKAVITDLEGGTCILEAVQILK
jgi:hypothetical protein